MKAFLLAGNSVSNKDWIESVKKEFDKEFECSILYYRHWQNEGDMINLVGEAENLKMLVENEEEYVVFAKSAGTILVLQAISKAVVNPKFLMLVGIPLRFTDDVEVLIEQNEINTLIVQKTNDNVATFDEVKSVVEKSGNKNYELREIPGNDHYYSNLEELRAMFVDFVTKV